MFEIKKEGASLQIPGGYAAATSSGGIIAQVTSGALFVAPAYWRTAGCLLAGAAMGAGTLWL